MKEVDMSNFMPIDMLKIFKDKKAYIELNGERMLFRVNQDKIDWIKIDTLIDHFQKQEEVILEK